MLNQVLLVGRIKEILPDEIIVAIPRSYKNAEGIYDTDIIPTRVVGDLHKHVTEYCHVGDVVGIRGRLEQDGGSFYVNTEKLTFLSSSNSTEGGE